MHLFIYRDRNGRDAALVPDDGVEEFKEDFLLEPDVDRVIEAEVHLDLDKDKELTFVALFTLESAMDIDAGRGFRELIQDLILVGYEQGAAKTGNVK